MAFKKGHVIKTKVGSFIVDYVGYDTIGKFTKVSNCRKCDVFKIMSKQKQQSCNTILNVLLKIPSELGCPLSMGYGFKKIKGGM